MVKKMVRKHKPLCFLTIFIVLSFMWVINEKMCLCAEVHGGFLNFIYVGNKRKPLNFWLRGFLFAVHWFETGGEVFVFKKK